MVCIRDDVMSVYDINQNVLQSVYGLTGNAISKAYDINGIEVYSGVTFLDSSIVTNVYTSSITAQPQGGCIDDDGNIYVCFYSEGKFRKYNISTGSLTEVSFTPNAYGHANGMTYNPNTEYFYVASMKNTGEVYVFDASFNLVDTLYAKDANDTIFNCWNIAYDRIGRRFITMRNGTIYFFDDNFDLIKTRTYLLSDWPDTRQDIETDGRFIYAISYSDNLINVFAFSGALVKTISNSAFSGEPESMCYDWENDIYYIEGKSTYYLIRQAEFIEQ